MEKAGLEFEELKFIPQEYELATGGWFNVADELKINRKELEKNLSSFVAYAELMKMYTSAIEKNVREFLDRNSADEPLEITLGKTYRLLGMANHMYSLYCDLETDAAELAAFAEEQIYDFLKEPDMDEVHKLKSEINKKLKDEKNLITDKYYELKQKLILRYRRETSEYVGLPEEELARREKAQKEIAENKAKAKEQKRKERQLAMQNPDGLQKAKRLEKEDMQKWLSENPNATEYAVPEGVAVIGENAFDGLENLVKVTLPESLVVISRDAFNACKNLKNITVPKNVQLICNGAFRCCFSLESITLESAMPPQIESLIFEYSEVMKKIIVPVERANAYAEDANWKQYVSKND